MKLKTVIVILLPLAIYSCNLGSQTAPKGEILFPGEGATIKEGELILFSGEWNSSEIAWYDRDGNIISREKTFSVEASLLLSRVLLKYKNRVLDEINLTIKEEKFEESIITSSGSIDTSNRSSIRIISFGPETHTMGFTIKETDIKNSKRVNAYREEGDFRIKFNKNFTKPAINTTPGRSLGENIKLFIPDIDGSNNWKTYYKEFLPVYKGATVNVWIDIDDKEKGKEVSELLKKIDPLLYNRVLSLWGEPMDIDSSGSIDICFTSIINRSNKAIGFFNPNDLFIGDYSNRKELLYIGVPDSSSNYFGEKTLIATVVHELTHLINFQKTVLADYIGGNIDPKEIDLFLDEGLAHLTETLCGYSISGGNVKAFKSYINNPGAVSLVYKNSMGIEDSLEKRAATSAFLNWLFWETGGYTDNAGVSFLRNILDKERSLNSISSAYGKDINILFEDWVDFLMEGEVVTKYDTITNEPLLVHPYLAEVYPKGVQSQTLVNDVYTFLPYSFNLFTINTDTLYIDKVSGNAFTKLALY